jgi:hypothetical protein
VAIEQAVSAQVSRVDLYSGDAKAIWPELFASEANEEERA